MSKYSFLLLALFLLSQALAPQAFSQCMADAGTITVNDDGGGTNPFVVCFGEAIDVTSDGNFTLPPSGPLPAMVYLFYSCPPTGPDPAADPCWTNWFWTGSNMQTTNDGGIVGAVGINTFIIVPTVIDNNQAPPNGPGIDVDGDLCWDINPDDTETFTFLNEIEINLLDVDECAGEVTIEIIGGYPELFAGNYSLTNTGDGTLGQSGAGGGIVTISGLMPGDSYSFELDDDGNGCMASFPGGVLPQAEELMLFYPPICEGGSVFPSLVYPDGGDFDFVTPPGDGADIDASTGEVTDVLDNYEIIYTWVDDCGEPQTITYELELTPPPPPPVVDAFYEFCPEDNTVIFPGGGGDFFSLYDDEFATDPISNGSGFDLLDYLEPGDPEMEFFVSQTIDDCESELVAFSVIIYGDSPPLIDPEVMVCEGEEVTLEPISGNDNNNSDFYFYSDPGLNDLLASGATYTFTPTVSTTIYITELNEVCETVPEPVEITVVTPPTATAEEPVCYANNALYSVLITTDATDVIASSGFVINNNDGTFSIIDIPSGNFLDLILENAAADCNSTLELPDFDCGCAAPPPPVTNGNLTICAGEMIPALSVNVGAGQTVDWYDAPTDGTLLLAGNTSFTPTVAGTYYAETRLITDGCVSSTRTAVSLTINPVPSLTSSVVDCAPNLLSYSVTLDIANAASITVNAGMVTNNGSGSFTVSNIPVGTALSFTAFGADMNCTLGPEIIASPSCPCPVINDPVTTQNITICPSDPVPSLNVTVAPGLTADWYDQANGGNLLAGNTLSFTPPSTGTFYLEARDPVNDCVSNRISVTISTSPAPTYTVQGTSCAADLLTYQVQLTTGSNNQLATNAGTVTANGGGSFTVTGIPAGMNLSVTITNTTTTCSTTGTITAPDCNCAVVAPPVSAGDLSICTGTPLPTLNVSVLAGTTVDWYNAPVGGMLLASNNTSFTPTMAGTYYAEARVLADGCVSSTRTAVTLTINPTPIFNSFDTICSPDLLSYTVILSITDAASLTTNAGMITDMGGGNFTISNIPAGTALTYTAFNSDASCSLGPNNINAPSCPCPDIVAPVPNPVASICPGDAIPSLSVTTEAGLTADWYDDPTGGSLLASNTLTFTPPAAGTYFAEARDPINNCISERVALTIITNPTPDFSVIDAVCALDLLSYQVTLQVNNADELIVNTGMVTDNGGGSYTVTGIPSGTNLMLTLNNTVTGCSANGNVPALDCTCGTVNPPMNAGNVSICDGEPIPDLMVTVQAGQTVDWYDASSDGNLLLSGSTSFAATVSGTYFAETRVIVDDCVSFARTPVTLTINPSPTIIDFAASCAPNLLTYTVAISTTNTVSLQTDFGTIVNNGGGNYTISGIPAGTDVTFLAFNTDMSCSAGPQTVLAPDCSCPMINPPVTGGDRAICAGAPIPNLSVTVGANETADWYDAATGGNLLASASLSFLPPAPGTYFAEARNTINNCVSERIAISFTENPLPSFTLLDTVCAPNLLTYQVELQVSNADQVIPSLGNLVDNGGGSYTITDIPSGLTLNFTLNNTTTGCTLSASTMAPNCSCPVLAAPMSNGNVAICDGDPIPTLIVMVAAGETVDWYTAGSGGMLLLADNASFTPTAPGTYFAETRDPVNNCVSDNRTPITIIVNPTPVLEFRVASCAPDLLTYGVVMTLSNTATIQVNEGVVTNTGAGNFTISGIPAGVDLIFTAFNNGMSCSLGPLTVAAPDCSCPMVAPPVTGNDPMICAGDPIPTLSAMVSNGFTVDWYDAATGGNQLLMGSVTFTPTAVGTFYAEARDIVNNCVSERIAITIIENSVATPSSVGDEAICAGEPLPSLSAMSAAGETIDWYDAPTGGNLLLMGSTSFQPALAGTFYAEARSLANGCTSNTRIPVTLTVFDLPVPSVSSSNDPGCDDNDGSIVLSASGGLMPYQYQLNNGPPQDDPTFDGLGVGNYNLQVIDANGCSDNLTQTLNPPPTVEATIAANGLITCASTEVLLDAAGSTTGTAITYAWEDPTGNPLPATGLSANAIAPGNYTLVVTNTATNCNSTATINVQADLQAPHLQTGDDGLITCEAESATLSASSNTPNVSYSWEALNGGEISGATHLASITALAAGSYQVTVFNPVNGCSQVAAIEVTEIINTEIDVVVAIEPPSCLGDENGSIQLTPAIADQVLLFAPEGGAFSFNNTFFNLGAGVYHFTVQDEFGCEVSTSVTLPNGNDLTVELGADIYLKLGEVAQFNPTPSTPEAFLASIQWTNPQWLDCDTCLQASTVDSLANTTLFQLTIADSLGCTATDDIRVFIDRTRQVYIPNIFSPNNDGSNDVFFVSGGADIESIRSFSIFNRWGELVFEKKDLLPNMPSAGWDGTTRGGQLLNPAVFVYMVEIRFTDGETEVFSGDVVLMR
ncbi:gliding motility-associated C-terminal domain-containing protein [Lewinella sp. LCG006]|uniref:Ig-like domain-containing protein n=1 Tax=Lewinella sp. LCG006 TaxID=3231911 RepID=UPI0034617469